MYNSKKIRFDLINPTSPLWRVKAKQRPVNSSVFRFSMLPSLYVAASMPSNVESRIIDEDVEAVDFNTDADLIGISFMTYNAPRAYEIADRFRAQGKKVILGGYHPTFMQEEAIQHADAICLGESENNIPLMIDDFMNGGLKPFYKSELVDLEKLPKLNRELIRHNAYVTTNAMQATRGCIYKCEFCSVAAFNRYQIRTRPIGQVIEELKGLGRSVLFMDDNIGLNRAYAKELFKAMKPLGKRWFSQCGIKIADDEELLRLAFESGCRGLFIGFESLSQESLESWNKQCNRRRDYLQAVRNIHNAGIGIFAGFVFGSDNDGPDVFSNTFDFLLEANIEVLQSTRLTPFPGTPLFDKMDKEGRIVTKDWSHYDFFHVVHSPLNMDAETLHYGTAWLQRQFYAYKSISRRVRKAFSYLDASTVTKVMLPLNLGYRFKLSAYGAFQMAKAFDGKNAILIA
ncbi:B12-binding domain-containing radical SAM protein [uncultured Draconibacterium sp.]|uniref:B12-binding domain-containing radical SAM protein n=1 Tax=uncultured Draconibacterium sp. TaxID=1573823 RepID=UPI003217EFF6